MKRRNFGKLIIAGSALGAAGVPELGLAAPAKKTTSPTGVDYYNRAVEIWDNATGRELPKIIKAADEAADRLKKGGKLYTNAFTGHMLSGDLRNGRAGSPDYLRVGGIASSQDSIGAGDFVLFDTVNMGIKKAHDNGAYCVGFVTPYRKSKAYPKGVHGPHVMQNQEGIEHDDVADMMIDVGLAFSDGVLYYPEIVAARTGPLSVQGAGSLHWMLSAEIAYRDKVGKGGKAEYALAYMKKIRERGAKMRKDNPLYDEVAREMTKLVSQRGSYWAFSGGERVVMFSENTGRSSGIAMVRSLNAKSIANVKSGDFVVFGGEFSDVKENTDMARGVKEKGAKIIWIGPSRSDGSLGDDMSKLADWTLDTYSPELYGVLKVPGFENPICPTTGTLYALGLWMLNAQFVARMIEAGMVPVILMGIHLLGGREWNAAARVAVTERGY